MLEVLAIVLAFALTAILLEGAHAKWCDRCQRIAVQRTYLACLREARDNWKVYHPLTPGTGTQVAQLADQIFREMMEKRRANGEKTLPAHLFGVPARTLIARAA